MNTLANLIVASWLLPLILFVIVPLLLLCGWIVLQMILRMKNMLAGPAQPDDLDAVPLQTETGR